MVKLIIISFFFFIGFTQPKHKLEITIDGVEKVQGFMMIALYQPNQEFLGDDGFLFRKVKVTQPGTLTLELELPEGKYAVSIYHDLNEDGELNTNFLGIPKEPYGFSITRGSLGPPSFEEASFTVPERRQITIEIE